MNYRELVSEFSKNPRDVHTVPLTRREHKWFYVFVDGDVLCVESAHNHTPRSSLKKRKLPEKECENMLLLYRERKSGKSVSAEAHSYTYSQVYWYGVFSALGL